MRVIKPLSIGLILITLLLTQTEIAVNHSKSLPFQVFWVIKNFPYKEGEYVTIKGHKTKYIPDVSITKRVHGLEGVSLSVKDLPLKMTTLKGQPLTPLFEKSVSPGKVFILGDHKDSFDSRYEEFGLVDTKNIIGRAFPVWPVW